MQYRIIGNTVPAVEIELNNGESVYTQSGSMAWRTPNIDLQTNTKGGILAGLGRKIAGESFFMNTYTSTADGEKIAFAAKVPGRIIEIPISPTTGLMIQKGAFLCATPNVECKIEFTKKLSTGFFGGEGFVLQGLSGSGSAFLEIDGDMQIFELQSNQVILVDTGNVVAFDKTVSYEIEMVKGVKNILMGGEGMFLTKLIGPGKVILQTFNFDELTERIISKVPNRGNN